MPLRRLLLAPLVVAVAIATVLGSPSSEGPIEATRALSAGAAATGASGPAAGTAATAASQADEVIVRFAADAADSDRGSARAEARTRLRERLPLRGLELLEVEPGASRAAAIRALERRPDVLYAEPNHLRFASGSVDDRYFPHLWGLHNTGQAVRGIAGSSDADVDAPEAWDTTTGDPAHPVAVVDSGIAPAHPDLAGQIAPGGYDFVDDDPEPQDDNGHGTHVAGTIAARGRNAEGVAGLAFGTRVVALRALDAEGAGTVADVVEAFTSAARQKTRVVNASLGAATPSRAEQDAIRAAPDTLFVVAAGNGGEDGVGDDLDAHPDYPCSYPEPNIVCVAATDERDQLASFSNYGPGAVDIAAPGTAILSTVPPDRYGWSDGTSMAAPHVAAAAALVWARFPEASVAAVRAALLDSADRVAALAGRVASGRLNARGAVTAPAPAPAPPPNTSPAPESTAPTAVAPAPSPTPAPAPAAAPTAPAPAPPAAPAPAAASDTSAPVISVAVRSRRRVSVLLRRGLILGVSCSEGCRIDARLALPARKAAIARAAVALSTAGTRRITLRIAAGTRPRVRRALRRDRRVVVVLRVRDRAGNLRSVRRVVRLVRG